MMEPAPSSAKSLTIVLHSLANVKLILFFVLHSLVVQLVPLNFRGPRFRLTTVTSFKHTCQSNCFRDTVINLDSQRGQLSLRERSV